MSQVQQHDDLIRALFESMTATSVASVSEVGSDLAVSVREVAERMGGDQVALHPFYDGARATEVRPELPEGELQSKVEGSEGEPRPEVEDGQSSSDAEIQQAVESVFGDATSSETDSETSSEANPESQVEGEDQGTFPGVPHSPSASDDPGQTQQLYEQAQRRDEEAGQQNDDDSAGERRQEPSTLHTIRQEVSAQWVVRVEQDDGTLVAEQQVSPRIIQEVQLGEDGVARVEAVPETTWRDAAIHAARDFIRQHTEGVAAGDLRWRRRGSVVRVILLENHVQSEVEVEEEKSEPEHEVQNENARNRRSRVRVVRHRQPSAQRIRDEMIRDLPDAATVNGRTVREIYHAASGRDEIADRVAHRIYATVSRIRDAAGLAHQSIVGEPRECGASYDVESEVDLTPESLADELLRSMVEDEDQVYDAEDLSWITDPEVTHVVVQFLVSKVSRDDETNVYTFTFQVVR